MNPYDFVRIDWSKLPERRQPVWHHRLVDSKRELYAGTLELELETLTPFFLMDPRAASNDPKRPDQCMHRKNADGTITYVIPGSSLKGMLRCVVETLGNGCLTLFDGAYERFRGSDRRLGFKADYDRKVPAPFHHCEQHTNLCITCRTFGMLPKRGRGMFLGKVNVSEALSNADATYLYNPMYTQLLMEPKPHHQAFYLDESESYIAGRKYYFHHSPELEPLQENRRVQIGNVSNRYIQPLDANTVFSFRIDFTNLERDELAALLLSVTLAEKMRHKLGYAKPLGLGSVVLAPVRVSLVDYAKRYTVGAKGSKTVLEGDEFWAWHDELVDEFSETKLSAVAMEDLQRIWRWPGDKRVDYHYPSKRDWFDRPGNSQKRIADTIDA